MTSRIAFRCDAGLSIGVGHVMRSLALAEELRGRGLEPVFFSDSGTVPWLAGQLSSRGIASEVPPRGPADHATVFHGHFAAVVFDSYLLPPEVYRAVRETGMPTLALVDGSLRGAEADLFLDQNAGAELDDVPLPQGARRVAGMRYALIRDDVLALRPDREPSARNTERPEVLAVFGGTDAFGAAPDAVRALAATGRPFHATVVAPREELRRRLEQVRLGFGQRVTVIGPTDRLAELVRRSDLVVSAAGSSTWELLALGACAALVCVAENQQAGYLRLTQAGVAANLGMLSELRRAAGPATAELAGLLGSDTRRARFASLAWRAVDGEGRRRVADELLTLTHPGR